MTDLIRRGVLVTVHMIGRTYAETACTRCAGCLTREGMEPGEYFTIDPLPLTADLVCDWCGDEVTV